MAPTPLLYTPEQAAQMLGVGRTTLYSLMKSGELESVKVRDARRIPADALTAYIQQLREQNAAPRLAALAR